MKRHFIYNLLNMFSSTNNNDEEEFPETRQEGRLRVKNGPKTYKEEREQQKKQLKKKNANG